MLNQPGFYGNLGPQLGGPKYRGVSFEGSKALSHFKRFELSGQAVQLTNQQILPGDASGQTGIVVPGQTLNFVMPRASFVYDNTLPGNWGPVDGKRLRVDVGHAYGDVSFNQSTVDARIYKGNRDVSIALRAVAGTMDGRTPQYFFLGAAARTRCTATRTARSSETRSRWPTRNRVSR